jgi:hypothetical protein
MALALWHLPRLVPRHAVGYLAHLGRVERRLAPFEVLGLKRSAHRIAGKPAITHRPGHGSQRVVSGCVNKVTFSA